MPNRIFFLILFVFVQSGCNHLFYFPRQELLYPPENLNLKYENVEFSASDGTKLKGWFFQTPKLGKKTLGTIVHFHGNAENMSSHYLGVIWLLGEGYNVFTFDYRGYGGSQGKPTPKGTVLDGIAALRTALDKHKSGLFVVWGQSLGGAILQASVKQFDEQNRIHLIILEATFNSYRKVASSILKMSPVFWFLSPLAYVLISDRYAGLDFPKQNQIPVLIIHDEKDPTVPFSNGEDLFSRIQAPKTFWRTNLGGHLRTFAPDQSENRQRLVQFLSKVTH